MRLIFEKDSRHFKTAEDILAIRAHDKFQSNLYSQFRKPVGQEIVKEMGGLIERDSKRYVMLKGDAKRGRSLRKRERERKS